MSQSSIYQQYDQFNMSTVFVVQNDELHQLSLDREFINKELDDMKKLVGNWIVVGAIDDRNMTFHIVVHDAIRTTPGAYEWFVRDVLNKIAHAIWNEV